MNSELRTMNHEKPRLIAFEVTRRCRFNCRHCRANAGALTNEQELTAEQCERILASIAHFNKSEAASNPKNKARPPIIILTGGEPMERTDIYELIRSGQDLGLQMVMATCGYMIDDSSIAQLKEAGISALSFSLDGAFAKTHDAFRQTDGAFDLTVNAAKTAHRAGVRFQINTTISKINIDEVIAIAELAKELGAYCFNPFILVPTGRAEKIADAVIDPVEYEALLNELLR